MLATFGYTIAQMEEMTLREASNLIYYKNEDQKEDIKFRVALAGGDPKKLFNEPQNPYREKEETEFKNREKLEKLYRRRIEQEKKIYGNKK